MALGTPKPLSVIFQQRSSRDWRWSTQTSLQLQGAPKELLVQIWILFVHTIQFHLPTSNTDLVSLHIALYLMPPKNSWKRMAFDKSFQDELWVHSSGDLKSLVCWRGSTVRSWPTELQIWWYMRLMLHNRELYFPMGLTHFLRKKNGYSEKNPYRNSLVHKRSLVSHASGIMSCPVLV